MAQTGKGGLVVRDFDYKAWDNLARVWSGWGAAAPGAPTARPAASTDPPMVDAMTFIHEAIFAKKAMPGPGQTVDFFAGDAAMTITQISRASLLPKDKRFDWDLVPLPAGPGGRVRGRSARPASACCKTGKHARRRRRTSSPT